MITIPEYIYNDNTIEFVCPALELAREDAVRMHAVLTEPSWPDVLDELMYICLAFLALGFDSNVVRYALIKRYDCCSLSGCLKEKLTSYENRKKHNCVVKRIRKAWCDHMRDCLEKTLKQG